MGATQRENTDHVCLRYGLRRSRKQRFPGTLSIPHCRYLTLVLINCKQAHPSGEITKQYYVSHFTPLCTALILVNVLTLPKSGTIFRCTLFVSRIFVWMFNDAVGVSYDCTMTVNCDVEALWHGAAFAQFTGTQICQICRRIFRISKRQKIHVKQFLY